jgi:aspartokinase-like uncharacterized kinase
MTLTVYKIGGSLAESATAKQLLQHLRDVKKERVIVVPGGGTFADAVRGAQSIHNFSDRAAHHMALMAMRTMARMLVDLVSGYELADDEAAMHACWTRGSIPIWCPENLALADSNIEESWDVTSDSLAAWLAARMNATRLIILKSCAVAPEDSRNAARLVVAGVVDAAFERYANELRCDWRVTSSETFFWEATCRR